MDHMSKWELCIATKQSLNHKPLTIGQPPTHQSHHQADFSQALIKDVGSFSAFSANNTVSISLRLKLRFEAQRLPKDVDVLWGNVSLVDLGLSGKFSAKREVCGRFAIFK